MDSTFKLYVKSKLRRKKAGFLKFITNSGELRARIEDNERLVSGETGSGAGDKLLKHQ